MLWRFNARSFSVALLAGGLFAAVAPGYVWRRLTFGFDADANTVSADRLDGIWTPLMSEFWKSPVWGNGIDSIMWAEPMRAGEMLVVGHPHNAYLQTYMDMGLLGLALLLAFYWHVWKGFRALGSNAYISPELRGFFQGAAPPWSDRVTGVSAATEARRDFAYLWIAIGIMYGAGPKAGELMPGAEGEVAAAADRRARRSRQTRSARPHVCFVAPFAWPVFWRDPASSW